MQRDFRISFLVLATAGLIFGACSSPQTDEDAKQRKKKGENKAVEEGVTTSLQISDGSLSGTAVDVPAGALPEGSNVNLRKTNTPSSFTGLDDVEGASDSVAITAQDADGNELTELIQPMTIQLPIAATSLTLAIDKSDDNVCTFLETADGDRYVWRRAALSIKSGKVTFESKRLGVFQVVYCGKTKVSGFAEAAESEVAGTASVALAEITIPAHEFDSNPAKYCAGVISGVEDDSKEGEGIVWGFTEVEAHPAAAQVITIKRSPGKDLANLADSTKTFLFLFSQQATDICSFENKEIDRPGGNVLAWRQAGAVFKTGSTVSGTVGANLPYKTIPLSITTGSAYAKATAKSICIETKTGGAADGGISETTTKISADGLIGDQASFDVLYVPGGTTQEFYVYLGTTSCGDDSQSHVEGNVVTDPAAQVIRASFHKFTSKSALTLAPVSVKVVGISSLPGLPISFPNACVSILDPADAVTNADNESHYKKALLSFVVSAGASAQYESYLPMLDLAAGASMPSYDMLYKGLSSTSATCSSSGKNSTKTPNKVLTNPVTVAPAIGQ